MYRDAMCMGLVNLATGTKMQLTVLHTAATSINSSQAVMRALEGCASSHDQSVPISRTDHAQGWNLMNHELQLVSCAY